jgi:lysyl-tRNA synthetase class I
MTDKLTLEEIDSIWQGWEDRRYSGDDLRRVFAAARASIEWKAIAQTHNDSLVARIEENERLKQACDGYLEHAAGLRAENERLNARAEKAEAYMDQFAAESNRLREALESVRNMPFTNPDELRSIARAALRVEESAPSAESATYNERWKSKP